MNNHLIVVFSFSLVFLFVLRKLAKKIGLVDKPDHRKHHHGMVPLVGGLSVYAGLVCYSLLVSWQSFPHLSLYLLCAGILVLIGTLDDRFDVSVKIRAFIQALLAITMMLGAGLYLKTFGYVSGWWELTLGRFGYVLTLLAVWAAINAFNMMDGIDGLLGGVSCVAFAAIGVLFLSVGQSDLAGWSFAVIAAILPYLLLNLGFAGKKFKVFIGDAGSTLIGFTVIWLLLLGTQSEIASLRPVTALWIIAVPLIDMVAIMYRRLRKGMSPFVADRQHLHHLLLRAGFTPRQTLALITLASALLATFGVISESVLHLPEWVMLVLFLLLFLLYGYCVAQAPRLAQKIKRVRRQKSGS